MRNLLRIVLVSLITITGIQAQGVFGKWKTIDDNTGEARSVIEIYEKGGKVYGKIVAITDPAKRDNVCTNCTGDDKNRPILGLELLKGLEKNGDKYDGGYITDPDNGKRYKCYIELEDVNTLRVRGYIGMAVLGRTQIWERFQE